MIIPVPLRTMIRPPRALASCQAGMAAALDRLGRADRFAGIAGAVIALLRRRTRDALASWDQASPSFRAALAASILLHVAVLAGLLALQRHALPRFADPAIAVSLTPEDAAIRLGARAGIDWESPAGQAALAALREARREAALTSELVIPPARPPRAEYRPSARAAISAPKPSTARAEHGAAPPPPAAAREPNPTAAAVDPARAERPHAAASALQPPAAAGPASRPEGPAAASASMASAAAPSLDQDGHGDQRYLDAVFERLRRLRDYPGLAKYHTSGRVLVAFTVARDGTVLSAEVRRSSGYSFLDRAGVDMIRRASPLPALPASLPRESLAILIPINFWYR